MKHLPTLKGQLKELLLEGGMASAMHGLRDNLPADSPKYNAVLQLEAEYRELETQMIRGLLSFEQAGLQSNRLRDRLLALIDGLEADDFSPQLRRSRFRQGEKVRRGHVLYQIPHTMQVGEDHRCLVRIAFDREMLLDGFRLDEHTQVRENLRVSDYMKVDLVDPSPSPAFEIRTTSPPEQVVDEDDHTEWRFYVKPLVPGRHLLELKVVIMVVMEDGRTLPREKTLEESVVIVSEPVEAPAAGQTFKTLEENLLLGRGIEARESGFRLPKGLQAVAGALALLMLASTATYALAPQEAAWAYMRYLRNSKAAYEQYIEQYPESRHVETAAYRRAKVGQDAEAYEEYLAQYEGGKYQQQAAWEVAELTRAPIAYLRYLHEFPAGIKAAAAQARIREMEPRLWQALQGSPSLQAVDQYLSLYPESDKREEALAYLGDSSLWQGPVEEANSMLARITGHSLEERLLAHAEAAPTADALESFIAHTNNPALAQQARQALNNFQPPASHGETAEAPFSRDNPEEQPAPPAKRHGVMENEEAPNPPIQSTLVEPSTAKVWEQSTPCATQGGDADGDGLCAAIDCNDNDPAVRASRDSDGDGLCDDRDACLDQPGPAANKGCPEPPEPASPNPGDKDLPIPEMVKIEGSAFTMGCQEGRDQHCYSDEKPAHQVTVSTFYMSKHEVTNEQYAAFLNAYGSDSVKEGAFKGKIMIGSHEWGVQEEGGRWRPAKGYEKHPVVNVSWYGAYEYCAWLSQRTGKKYRLPTEAEWEYAARGGVRSKGYLFAGGNELDEVGWFGQNSGGKTHSVGQKRANELGLYDMSGNVLEWCGDWYDENYYQQSKGAKDPQGPSSGMSRVLRGGSWYDDPRYCRCTARGNITPVIRDDSFGFRLVLPFQF
ncbi:MAG: formylglycine-generating enzyme family protein [Phaeodactylibacter sp.]|nr:formylglycine-generating enzyme family protein [Phaeodactylibacter sp.]MCB9049179.1 formylglycine-generating enzyme family protein [Lewinellaceae bacterium]